MNISDALSLSGRIITAVALGTAFAASAQSSLAAPAAMPALIVSTAPLRAMSSAQQAVNCWATIDASTVFSSTDAQAVRDAVAAAVPGDTVKVAGTCAGVAASAVVTVSNELTLRGGYTESNWLLSDPVANPTVLDAQSAGRVVLVTAGGVALDGLTITNGAAPTSVEEHGGGVHVSAGAVFTFVNGSVISNTAPGFISSGGGIAVLSGMIVVSNTLFEGNLATSVGQGGALYVAGSGTSVVLNTRFENNRAQQGAAISMQSSSDLSIIGSVIAKNVASSIAGGVFAAQRFLITDTQFISNTATFGGGGAYVVGDVTLNRARFERNVVTGSGNGGGLTIQNGSADIRTSVFVTNSATNGGAIFVASAGAQTSHISGTLFRANHTSNEGGAIFTIASSLTATFAITSSPIISNHAVNGGGAIYFGNGSIGLVDNSVFARNTAADGPADIGLGGSNVPATVAARHNTFVAAVAGSGIAVEVGHDVDNESGSFVNSIFDGYATALTFGTRVATMTVDGVLWSNVLTPTGFVTITVNNAHTGSAAFVDRAADDYHVSITSDALERGVNAGVASDIDGEARPFGAAPDLGFDEFVTPPISVSASNDSPGSIGSSTRLTATLLAGAATTYTWSFGDGQSGGSAVLTHTYAAPGVYTAIVTASNVLVSASASTLVTVTNASPTISALNAVTRAESSGMFSVTFTIGDLETPVGALTVTVDSDNPALLQPVSLGLSGSGALRTLTVSPANNVFGTATITVTVRDAHGGVAVRSFQLMVLQRRLRIPLVMSAAT